MHFLKQGGRNKEQIQRAIREKMAYNQSLGFLELSKISPKALKAIFHFFEMA